MKLSNVCDVKTHNDIMNKLKNCLVENKWALSLTLALGSVTVTVQKICVCVSVCVCVLVFTTK